MDKKSYKSVDEYFESVPLNVRQILEKVRDTIKKTAPHAKEVISYNMPAYKQNGILVYFAANKNHIGFYPTTSPIIFFRDELAEFNTSKGAIQFPIDKSIPYDLIEKIVKYRIQEDSEKAKKKLNNVIK